MIFIVKPPKMKVISDIWHPNIEKNGDVCISILHEPGNLILVLKHGLIVPKHVEFTHIIKAIY